MKTNELMRLPCLVREDSCPFVDNDPFLPSVAGASRVARAPDCGRSPNLNAFAERFVRSIKRECLDRMIFFGEASLWHAVTEYVQHYHVERPHQGLGNVIPFPPPNP